MKLKTIILSLSFVLLSCNVYADEISTEPILPLNNVVITEEVKLEEMNAILLIANTSPLLSNPLCLLQLQMQTIQEEQKEQEKQENKKYEEMINPDSYGSRELYELLNEKGIIYIDGTTDFIKIKDSQKDENVIGYLKNNDIVTVYECGPEYAKIKSGKILGYIKSKHLAVATTAQQLVINNECLEATFTVDETVLHAKSNITDDAIGVGYKGSTYTVLGFNNDYKKLKIQRTENIVGWTKVKNIKLSLKTDKALSADEYDEYIKKQEEERQQAIIDRINATSISDDYVETVSNIISNNESGDYSSARNGLSQFPGEKTITVGAWQWYGERAHNILRQIVQADKKAAKELILDSLSGKEKKKKEKFDKLYGDILSYDNWESQERHFSNEELIAVKELLSSKIGIQIQNNQNKTDINKIVDLAKNTYHLTNKQVIAYYADLHWQSPSSARRILKKCIDKCDGTANFDLSVEAIDIMYDYTIKDSVMGYYKTRRTYTYEVCKKIKLTKDYKSLKTKEDKKKTTKKTKKKKITKKKNKKAAK